MENTKHEPKPKGRPKKTGAANAKMMRVIITQRQQRLLDQLRNSEIGMSESEHCRRALDNYLEKLISRGELVDNGPVKVEQTPGEK